MSWKVSSAKRLIVERSDMRIVAYLLTMPNRLPTWPGEKAGGSPRANQGASLSLRVEL
jgi:hypothetical protein